MFAAYTSEGPFRCPTQGHTPGLTHKHKARLERLAKDKHSRLLQKSVNYDTKKFYGTGPSTLLRARVRMKNAKMPQKN
jgi:hypothetical protein